MDLKLGINTGFALNRYIEPEVWGQIVGEELNLHSVQLTASLLNPFWDDVYLVSLMKRIKNSSKRYGFSIDSVFTDAYTRVNHLANPDEYSRKMWLDWFKKLFSMAAELGAVSGGSHFGIMTFDSYDNADKRSRTVDACVKGWQQLSKYAKEIGFEYLIFEPMSVPREFGCTIADTKELLELVNADCGVPMKVCLDVGHAPHPDERDCYSWIRQLGSLSPIIHIQQTQLNHSNHWPFTDEYNQQGYITAEQVIECLQESGCEKAALVFELSHREHWDTDFRIIDDHKASVDYWRKYVEE